MKMLFALALIFSFSAHASQPSIEFLHGLWEGESHQTNHDGTISHMSAAECVYGKHAGKVGAIGIVEGRHLDRNTGELLFGTYGVLSRLDNQGAYRFNIFLHDGTTREASATIDSTKGTWIWNMELPPGSNDGSKVAIRYTIQISHNEWIERGEASKDSGKTWNGFFKMNLKKSSQTCAGF